ncbi:ABC transporter permease [Spirosoma sp. RP8]|uniref:ABC transporter permease n=1 Tax=Spirosoma liriopis TaxID=2937440 RepID=A0ABT0HRK3_9BACT|nr:ABC transporter permease [Spirosoma liriopis]MCK8494801.1 ABC transporter permease [Spirosoma liriopis]
MSHFETTAISNPNLPTHAYGILASVGIGTVSIATLLAGQSLTKDWDQRTTPYLYSLPVAPGSFLIGGFVGTLIVVLVITLGYPLGIGLLQSTTASSGPFLWLVLLNGYMALTVGQVFTLVSIAFSLTVLFRSLAGAYFTLTLSLLYLILTVTTGSGTSPDSLFALLDPFGTQLIQQIVAVIPTNEPPSSLLSWPDPWYINRLLWLAVSLALLNKAINTFTFNWADGGAGATFKPALVTTQAIDGKRFVLPVPSRSCFTKLSRVGRLALFELKELSRQPLVQAMTLSVILFSFLAGTILQPSENFIGLPTTATMTALRHPMGALISFFLVLMTGEVLHRERNLGLGSIYETLPQPIWVRLVAKLLALSAVAGILVSFVGLVGIVIQVSSQFPLQDIDWSLYGQDLVIDTWVRQIQLIALVMCITAWASHRLLGHALSISLLFLLLYSEQTDAFSPWLLYSVLPGSEAYSDLTGYGNMNWLRMLFSGQWTVLAIFFVGLSTLRWSSGISSSATKNQRSFRYWLERRFLVMLISCLVAFILFVAASARYHSYIETLPPVPIRYMNKTVRYQSVDGRRITVMLRYVHSYQASKFLQSSVAALRRGEQLLGSYPHDQLLVEETPNNQLPPIQSSAGYIRLSEQQGWTAHRDSTRLDYIDYLLTREILGQWWHHLPLGKEASQSFFTQSIPEYMALQAVKEQYGLERFGERLAQRAKAYAKDLAEEKQWEPTLMEATGQPYVSRYRAALVFASIGQVWGDSSLQRCIDQFYFHHKRNRQALLPIHFTNYLADRLPDSLGYLTDYLKQRYQFRFAIGRISRQPADLAVDVSAQKIQCDGWGHQRSIAPNDWVPIVLRDAQGRQLYRTLIRPSSDQPPFRLPLIEGSTEVVIDPLGAWMARSTVLPKNAFRRIR